MQAECNWFQLEDLLRKAWNRLRHPLVLMLIDQCFCAQFMHVERHMLWIEGKLPERLKKEAKKLLVKVKKVVSKEMFQVDTSRIPAYAFFVTFAALGRNLTQSEQVSFWTEGGRLPEPLRAMSGEVMMHFKEKFDSLDGAVLLSEEVCRELWTITDKDLAQRLPEKNHDLVDLLNCLQTAKSALEPASSELSLTEYDTDSCTGDFVDSLIPVRSLSTSFRINDSSQLGSSLVFEEDQVETHCSVNQSEQEESEETDFEESQLGLSMENEDGSDLLDEDVPVIKFGVYQHFESKWNVKEKLQFWLDSQKNKHRNEAKVVAETLSKLIPAWKVTLRQQEHQLHMIWFHNAFKGILCSEEQINFWTKGCIPEKYQQIAAVVWNNMDAIFKKKQQRLTCLLKLEQYDCLWYPDPKWLSEFTSLEYSEVKVAKWASYFSKEVPPSFEASQKPHMYAEAAHIDQDISWAFQCFEQACWVEDQDPELEQRRKNRFCENLTAILNHQLPCYQLVYLNQNSKNFTRMETRVYLATGFVLAHRLKGLVECKQWVEDRKKGTDIIAYTFTSDVAKWRSLVGAHVCDAYFPKTDTQTTLQRMAQHVPDIRVFSEDMNWILGYLLQIPYRDMGLKKTACQSIKVRHEASIEKLNKVVENTDEYRWDYKIKFWQKCRENRWMTATEEEIFKRTSIAPKHLLDTLETIQVASLLGDVSRETEVLCRLAGGVKLNEEESRCFHSGSSRSLYATQASWADQILSAPNKEAWTSINSRFSCLQVSNKHLRAAFQRREVTNDYRFKFYLRCKPYMTPGEVYVFESAYLAPVRLLQHLEVLWLEEPGKDEEEA